MTGPPATAPTPRARPTPPSSSTTQTIAQFHLWNHESNGGLASNGSCAATPFVLRFFDADNNLPGEVQDEYVSHTRGHHVDAADVGPFGR